MRGVLRSDAPLFGACPNSHYIFSKTEFRACSRKKLIRCVLRPDGRLFGVRAATGGENVSAERSSQSTQPRARCSPFGRGAWRPAVRPSGGAHGGKWHNLPRRLPRQRCRSYASAEGAPMCTLVLLIRSFPGPPQSTGARHRRARTLFGVKPAGGGYCIPMLGAVCLVESVWVRTKIIRSVLRPALNFFEDGITRLSPQKTYSKCC